MGTCSATMWSHCEAHIAQPTAQAETPKHGYLRQHGMQSWERVLGLFKFDRQLLAPPTGSTRITNRAGSQQPDCGAQAVLSRVATVPARE